MAHLEYFVGGVPAGAIFRMDTKDLNDIVNNSSDESTFNKNAEIAFIALACYFEAYFKNQFASVINTCPSIVDNLITKRPDLAIGLKELLLLDFDISNKIGFLISEQFDFGTAKVINNLYKDLLLITPFSKDDTDSYNEMLGQRNLLVHHGGIYTMKYTKQNFAKEIVCREAFFNSLIIKKKNFEKWYKFTLGIVNKTDKACYAALKIYVEDNSIFVDEEQLNTIEAFLWDV